jgi:hypothetical protein
LIGIENNKFNPIVRRV